ncbi:MAG TPA: Rnf-Nqr domain containing protein [Victivallales bacterium]|nr:Rnf-Nqr domain containing protein [Victivallales bacterium]
MDNMILSSFTIFFSAIFTQNVLLTYYLGMCPFLGASREIKTAAGLGTAVTLVMACTTALNWLVYYYVLIPFNLQYLRFIIFIIVIAAFVQIAEIIIERVSDKLYQALGIFLPLITVNCAILGVCLFMVIREYDFVTTCFYGIGSGLGWMLAILAMAGIRQKMVKSKVPGPLAGAGISLIIAGIMAISFMGLAGVIK